MKPEKRIASIVPMIMHHLQAPGNTTLEVAAAHVPLGSTMSMWHRRVLELLAAPKVFSATLARLGNIKMQLVNSK